MSSLKPPRSVVWWMAVLGLSLLCAIWINNWEILGFSNSEVYGHVWSHSWRWQDFPDSLLGTNQTVGSGVFPVIDLIPSLLTTIFALLFDLNSAYNAVFILSVLSCAWAGAQLAKMEEGHIFAGSLVLSTSPIFWGALNSGLTEDWGLVLTVASMIALYNSKPFIAGVILGITAYSGLVLGWMSGIWLALVCCVVRKDIRSLPKIFMGAFFMVLPLILIHSERLQMVGHRTGGTLPKQVDPFWMLNPWHQTDLASVLWGGSVQFSDSIMRLHPAYLGWFAFILALRSNAWRWWLVFLLCLGFSLGPEIYWMGRSTGFVNPLHFILSVVPGGELLNRPGRWMVMALLSWVILVSKGVQQKWGHFLLPMVVLEFLFFSPLGFPIMGTPSISSSNVLLHLQSIELPSSSRILRIPVNGPGVVFQQALYEQSTHGQNLWLNPNRPDPSQWFSLQPESKWIERIAFDKNIPENACVPSSVAGLLVAEPYVTLIAERFSVPILQDSQYAFWTAFPTCD